MQELIKRMTELLESGEVQRVVGWKKGTLVTIPNLLISKQQKHLKISYTTVSVAQTFQNI